MKHVLIIGSGLSGLSCAIELANKGVRTTLVSPYPSERAQSVMAAGGINAAMGKDDSPHQHAEDTVKSGREIASQEAVLDLCSAAPEIISFLEALGVVFSRTETGEVALRAFGGQSRNRTAYAGASTGKQIMTAMIREARKYEGRELISRLLGRQFYSALIRDGRCYGALLYNEKSCRLETVYADAVVIATGGQNLLFGKTTGSTQCDGYAIAKLYEQGARLKNLEFIQYHPTTVETPQKRMLISEAARGEGGRLYYEENGSRVYFMEDKFGARGNLMSRDVVSKCIYDVPTQVYLDIAFLGKKLIKDRLAEVAEICQKYAGIDVTRESFYKGIEAIENTPNPRLGDLGYAIAEHARNNGFSVVEQYTGHGVGAELHEDPSVPNYGTKGRGARIYPGMTLAVEPMINEGTHMVKVLNDKWTVVTLDGGLSAHYEHSIAITNNGVILLTKVD